MTTDSFGGWLRFYRRSARDAVHGGPLSQERLADILSEDSGIVYSRAAVSDWERGKGQIHKDARHVLVALIRVLHRAGGLATRAEADAWLAAGNYRALDAAERAAISGDWVGDAAVEPAHPGLFLAPALPAHPIVGREALLAQLKTALFRDRALALSAVNGLPGVGKTALALLVAHDPEVRERFADGVLWIGLGPDPDVFAALGRWATAVGLPDEAIGRLGAIRLRADAVHEAIRHRRLLLVVDDVWDLAHAAPFRLGGPACAHLLTSRQPAIAAGFAGANAVAVRELAEAQGLELLRALAPRAVALEPDGARELVRASGGLPLALVLIGNDLRLHGVAGTGRRIREALSRLREAEGRFALEMPQAIPEQEAFPSLPGGAPISLRTVIGESDARLGPAARAALRALALLPPKPNSVAEEAALALAAVETDTLDTLVDHGLLEVAGRERYTLHPAIQEYASLTGEAASREAMAGRLLTYLAAFVARHRDDHAALALEMANIQAALEAADPARHAAVLWALLDALFPFLEERGHYDLAARHLARLAASGAGDAAAIALYRGRLAIRTGDATGARAHWEAGLARAGDDHDRAIALLSNLSLLASQDGDVASAGAYLAEAVSHARAAGNREEECRALGNMGRLAYTRDATDEAADYLGQALALAREHGFDNLASGILNLLGIVARARGAGEEALAHFLEGLHIARARRLGARTSTLLLNIGQLLNEQGRHDEALAYLEEGLALARELGDRSQESHLLMDLGVAAAALGDAETAMRRLEAGHQLARELDNRWLEAYVGAHWGLAAIRLGREEGAAALLARSLELAPEVSPNAAIRGLAQYGLAQIALRAGERDRADRLSRAALEALEGAHRALAAEVGDWRARRGLE